MFINKYNLNLKLVMKNTNPDSSVKFTWTNSKVRTKWRYIRLTYNIQVKLNAQF